VTRSATPKLRALIAIVALTVVVGLATGRVELVVTAVPPLAVLAWSLATTKPPVISVQFALEMDRAVEGDDVATHVRADVTAAGSYELELAVVLPPGWAAVGVTRAHGRPAAGEVLEHTFHLRAERWGVHSLGVVAVRMTGPARLIAFEEIVERPHRIKVYPAPDKVARSLAPPETQIYSGDYVARSAGDGIEFASVRPFVLGDSVRRVNWRVTSRSQDLHVNLGHPERNADLVLFLDTFTDVEVGDRQTFGDSATESVLNTTNVGKSAGAAGRTTLDIAVRGAAALAQHHLEHNDRVGLIGFGGMLHWLTASMGRTHVYRIADFLLGINATLSYAWKDIELLPHGTLPPSALVVALSPLVDMRALRALADISARGFSLVVVNTLPESAIAPSPGPEGELAHRAWRLVRSKLRDELRAAGVPVVTWSGVSGIQTALAEIPRMGRGPAVRHR
jgi:uncharacterized protein (DUF58 family)